MSVANPSSLRALFERFGPPLLFLFVTLVVWEAAVRVLGIAKWLLPAPSAIAQRFMRTQDLAYHTGLTLMEAGAGLAISTVLGFLPTRHWVSASPDRSVTVPRA